MFERIVGDAANCARGLIGLDEKLLDSSFMGIFKFKNFKLIISELIQIRLKAPLNKPRISKIPITKYA
jgi:hypothetical protein